MIQCDRCGNESRTFDSIVMCELVGGMLAVLCPACRNRWNLYVRGQEVYITLKMDEARLMYMVQGAGRSPYTADDVAAKAEEIREHKDTLFDEAANWLNSPGETE